MTDERSLGSSYILEDVIGRGAMGQVWRGRDREGHRLAFKLLRSELTEDPKVVQRFVQERSILTSITHPNVVRMRDLVVEGDTLAIVMDLVEGGDLREMLSGPRTLPPARVAELGAGIAAGLAAVHAAGVIHRDVKPENVLIDGASSPGPPRLTDFGIAKYVQSEGTGGRGTMLVGTPQYIAPELIDGNEPTPATDLYALGIMLYELVCGVTPFAGGSTLTVLRNHAERMPGRPAGVPDSLWDLISWLLGKHPNSRPQSASQVATLLDTLVPELAGLPAARLGGRQAGGGTPASRSVRLPGSESGTGGSTSSTGGAAEPASWWDRTPSRGSKPRRPQRPFLLQAGHLADEMLADAAKGGSAHLAETGDVRPVERVGRSATSVPRGPVRHRGRPDDPRSGRSTGLGL